MLDFPRPSHIMIATLFRGWTVIVHMYVYYIIIVTPYLGIGIYYERGTTPFMNG